MIPLIKKNGIAFHACLKRIIGARMELPKNAKHDFYSMAVNDVGEGDEGLKKSELWAEAVFILPAGGTTVSTAISATFFYLSRHARVYDRLAAEIRTTFSTSSDIKTGPQLASCEYLRAVIDESMRMSPPFVGTFWREPYSDEQGPWVVDGHTIPRGTIVGVNPYCIMHNEQYFPEPFEFRPERWLSLKDSSDETMTTMRRAFATFCAGHTGCLGKSMAYQETSLTIARTLWYFDFEKAPGIAGDLGQGEPGRADGRGRKDEYQLYDVATADHDGPNLVFKKREDFWKEL
jgi:cytochrome P450